MKILKIEHKNLPDTRFVESTVYVEQDKKVFFFQVMIQRSWTKRIGFKEMLRKEAIKQYEGMKSKIIDEVSSGVD